MAKSSFDAEKVPKSGWGVNTNTNAVNFHNILVWDTEDREIKHLKTSDRAAFAEGKDKKEEREYPDGIRIFGLWNVIEVQLKDPTWKPVPYRILDEACMVIAMILCPTRSQLTKYWPFNFDQSGSPRQSRLKLGAGVQCHSGKYERTEGGGHEEFKAELFSGLEA